MIQVKHTDFVLAAQRWAPATGHHLPARAAQRAVPGHRRGHHLVGSSSWPRPLSYLGIGLVPPAVSWGIAIYEALTFVFAYPHMLMFPILFLSCLCLRSSCSAMRAGRLQPQVPLTNPDSRTERKADQ